MRYSSRVCTGRLTSNREPSEFLQVAVPTCSIGGTKKGILVLLDDCAFQPRRIYLGTDLTVEAGLSCRSGRKWIRLALEVDRPRGLVGKGESREI